MPLKGIPRIDIRLLIIVKNVVVLIHYQCLPASEILIRHLREGEEEEEEDHLLLPPLIRFGKLNSQVVQTEMSVLKR